MFVESDLPLCLSIYILMLGFVLCVIQYASVSPSRRKYRRGFGPLRLDKKTVRRQVTAGDRGAESRTPAASAPAPPRPAPPATPGREPRRKVTERPAFDAALGRRVRGECARQSCGGGGERRPDVVRRLQAGGGRSCVPPIIRQRGPPEAGCDDVKPEGVTAATTNTTRADEVMWVKDALAPRRVARGHEP